MFFRPLVLGTLITFAATSSLAAQTLEQQLQQVSTAELAKRAREQGDAVRGAIVFFQPHMACAKCHPVGDSKAATLGPDLAMPSESGSDEWLVESVLLPSKVIRKGYETVVVVTTDGLQRTGIISERTNEQLVLHNLERIDELIKIDADDIEEIAPSAVSIMPAGQVNQLASVQQFLDLIRYLMEVREGGAARARALQPSPALLVFELPEYEQHVDHAGLIRDWDDESLTRGAAVYQRVCANCHGTREQPGSLPTSLRFAEGKFKNGSDPFAMYQTLTHGFGFMAAQTWMVPLQKYDVIHYIRETYLRSYNPAQYFEVDGDYLARLPKGDTRGPEPSGIKVWSAMDYGSSLTHTYEVPGAAHNFAYKGIAIRLDPGAGGVSRGRHWMIFDEDTLRVTAAWSATDDSQAFVDWRGVQFNGEHQIHPNIVGRVAFANATGPGWADPATGEFRDDQRVEGRDGRRYGPLPRSWGRFQGVYHHEQRVVTSYTVGDAAILESPSLVTIDGQQSPLMLRILNIGTHEHDLVLQVADHRSAVDAVALTVNNRREANPGIVHLAADSDQQQNMPDITFGVTPSNVPVEWEAAPNHVRLKIPASSEPLKFAIWSAPDVADPAWISSSVMSTSIVSAELLDLGPLTKGGPLRWPERLVTQAQIGADEGPFAVDVLTPPDTNPWLAQVRLTGLDFFKDGRMAVCSWDGDVWVVEQFADSPALRWQRIASGMFQPLGLKIVDGRIHVLCRDQLTVLHDLNADGETDFYECLNSDHQVTEHFHEFAMGLQTDREGNFYYAKSARHALPAVVPQHGTLLRVSPDGSKTDILATGFRAANGVCLNPDGTFVVTDQEGHWNPKNRINWVTVEPSGKPKFYGNLFGYTDVTDSSDSAMVPPLCWITNAFDRSPAELLWVDSDRWGRLNGALLNLSYGYGRVYVVPHEKVDGLVQGGMLALPIPSFPTGTIRGRFYHGDGHLYLCGMFSWAGSITQPGGLYRLRATGRPMYLVTGLHASDRGMTLTFTEPLDPGSIQPQNVSVKTWSLKRTAEYGSRHYDEKLLTISGMKLSKDGHSLLIELADIAPTWCMEIAYQLRAADGAPVSGVIHNTIHALRKD